MKTKNLPIVNSKTQTALFGIYYTMRIFSSAEYCRRVARRISRLVFSALSFFLVIIVPLQVNDEPNVSLIQTTPLVRLLLTANTT
jgi:hypothetical protein